MSWCRTRISSSLNSAEQIGFVTIDKQGYLDQLVVSPDHWGSPLATALVDEAKRLSPTGVTLKVNADNTRAIRFYERNGFIHDGEDVNPASKRLILKMAGGRDVLPFSPCGRRWREAPDEGFSATTDSTPRREPLTRLRFAKPPSPTRGEGKSQIPRNSTPIISTT